MSETVSICCFVNVTSYTNTSVISLSQHSDSKTEVLRDTRNATLVAKVKFDEGETNIIYCENFTRAFAGDLNIQTYILEVAYLCILKRMDIQVCCLTTPKWECLNFIN